ncbi:hypothetical protein [Micromonospora avicenniae]|uniref:hypothetical protein n=1 Tax=Micromonospora avicenniae TaxID=1198245 RepID=UPI003443EF8B
MIVDHLAGALVAATAILVEFVESAGDTQRGALNTLEEIGYLLGQMDSDDRQQFREALERIAAAQPDRAAFIRNLPDGRSAAEPRRQLSALHPERALLAVLVDPDELDAVHPVLHGDQPCLPRSVRPVQPDHVTDAQAFRRHNRVHHSILSSRTAIRPPISVVHRHCGSRRTGDPREQVVVAGPDGR